MVAGVLPRNNTTSHTSGYGAEELNIPTRVDMNEDNDNTVNESTVDGVTNPTFEEDETEVSPTDNNPL